MLAPGLIVPRQLRCLPAFQQPGNPLFVAEHRAVAKVVHLEQ